MRAAIAAATSVLIFGATPAASQQTLPTPPASDAVRLEISGLSRAGTAAWIDVFSMNRRGDRVSYWQLSTLHRRHRINGVQGSWTQQEADCQKRATRFVVQYEIGADLRLGAPKTVDPPTWSDGFYRPWTPTETKVLAMVCDGERPFPLEPPVFSVRLALQKAAEVG